VNYGAKIRTHNRCFDIMLNRYLFQMFKLIENRLFNYLISTLTFMWIYANFMYALHQNLIITEWSFLITLPLTFFGLILMTVYVCINIDFSLGNSCILFWGHQWIGIHDIVNEVYFEVWSSLVIEFLLTDYNLLLSSNTGIFAELEGVINHLLVESCSIWSWHVLKCLKTLCSACVLHHM
jgi:hypothetical protein